MVYTMNISNSVVFVLGKRRLSFYDVTSCGASSLIWLVDYHVLQQPAQTHSLRVLIAAHQLQLATQQRHSINTATATTQQLSSSELYHKATSTHQCVCVFTILITSQKVQFITALETYQTNINLYDKFR